MPRTTAAAQSPLLESLATALPLHSYTQNQIKPFAAEMFIPGLPAEDHRLMAVFDSSGIDRRHLCMPLEWYGASHDLAESNARYVEHAVDLAERAARGALDAAGLAPESIDHLLFVSTTGLATPSVDARLMNRVPFRPDLKRTPIWGLGCAGGAAGLARARDLALAHPDSRVLLVALELCSLTFQRRDLDRRNLVAASLFADGAAAAVVRGGAARPAPRAPVRPHALLASRSTLWPDTLDVMGWDVDGLGLHVIFSRDIPSIVRDRVRPNLDAFLEAQGLAIDGLAQLHAHPGGPRVLAAYAEALGWPAERLRHSAEVLRDCGNMSSPTCLFVLERSLRSGDVRAGDHGVVTALGPGFSSELVLLEARDA
jgi:alkylresorcinol/alkylpyrone synthase